MPINVDTYFRSRRDQFHRTSYQRIWRSNPFRSIIPMSQFNMEEGQTPTVVTYTAELPTAYPTSMTAVTVSNGTDNPACNPASTTILRGQNERTFQLYATSFDTPDFCLSDVKRAWQASEVVRALERSLTEYVTVWWSDYYRIQNIGMVDNKVGTAAAGAIEQVVDTGADHTGLTTLPAAELTWDHLNQLYVDLLQTGVAPEYSIGTANGRPVFPIVLGPYYYNKLFNDETLVRENVKYFNPELNLQALGPGKAVNGFVGFLDLFPIRYGNSTPIAATSGLTAANMIYPTVNANATIGRKYQKNPDYKVSGDAQFEVVTILPNSVYETLYEPSTPSAFGGMMSFKPTDYVGEFNFINSQSYRGDNDRKNLGYYLADIRVAAKPVWSDIGYSILTVAKDV